MYRRVRTLKRLMRTCDTSTTASIPKVFPADGLYPLLTSAVVEIRFAKPKSIPVVTAIWPRRLNLTTIGSMMALKIVEAVASYQPVIQAKKGALCWGASM